MSANEKPHGAGATEVGAQMDQRQWRPGDLVFWFTAAANLLALEVTSAEIREWVDHLFVEQVPGFAPWLALAYLSIFLLLTYCLYLMRATLFHPRTKQLRKEVAEPRANLIVFVSQLRSIENGGFPAGFKAGTSLQDDLDRLVERKKAGEPYWSWEMLLRAAYHHAQPKVLKRVIALCSPESIQQVHWLGEVVSQYREFANVKFQLAIARASSFDIVDFPGPDVPAYQHGGWDFEDFDELSAGVRGVLNTLKSEGIPENQIMIDFTGGQKVTSVVAVAATFNRNIMAQYVQTNPEHRVIGYDCLLLNPETRGLKE